MYLLSKISWKIFKDVSERKSNLFAIEIRYSALGTFIGSNEGPDDMFGKIMTIPDALIDKYYALLTNVSRVSSHPRDAKLALAKTIVSMYHGEKAGAEAEEYFIKVFSKKDLSAVELPEFKIKANRLTVLDLVSSRQTSKLLSLKSKLEFKRLISQGAVQIEGIVKKDFWEIVKLKGGETLKIGKVFFKIKIE